MLSDEWNLGWSNSQAAIRTECRAVSRPYEGSEKERVWKLLLEAGFTDIALDEFPERIKEAKQVVMGRLSELLELTTDIQERQSAAYSLAMLKKLETTVWRTGKRRSSD
jgi:hypothetical protein